MTTLVSVKSVEILFFYIRCGYKRLLGLCPLLGLRP